MKKFILSTIGIISVLLLSFSVFLYLCYTHFPDSNLYLDPINDIVCPNNQEVSEQCQPATPWQAFKHDWLGAYQ